MTKHEIIPVTLEDEVVALAFSIDKLIYVSLRKIQTYYKFEHEQRDGIVHINGHIVKACTIDSLCYVNIEELQKISLFQVEWDQHANILSLY